MDTLFPSGISELIGMFTPCFGANRFNYFRGFVLAYMLLGQTRKCMTDIARVCFFADRHVAGWERFPASSRREMPGVQQQALSLIAEQIRDRLLIHGAYPAWPDTTLIGKVGGKMIGVQKWHDHSGNPDRGDRLMGHHRALTGLVGLRHGGLPCSAPSASPCGAWPCSESSTLNRFKTKRLP